jgi:hypothetical protein
MSEGRRGGERRQHALEAYAPEAGTRDRCMHSGDASFARFFDPCASILTITSRTQVLVGEALGQYHGWENPHTVGRTSTGTERTDVARLAAWHRSRKRRRVSRREKEGGRGLRPCEDLRAPVWLPARRLSLQKSVGDTWSQISSANAPQKGRSGLSERGPSSERTSVGDTIGGCIEQNGKS